jgi:hypothetical protein
VLILISTAISIVRSLSLIYGMSHERRNEIRCPG